LARRAGLELSVKLRWDVVDPDAPEPSDDLLAELRAHRLDVIEYLLAELTTPTDNLATERAHETATDIDQDRRPARTGEPQDTGGPRRSATGATVGSSTPPAAVTAAARLSVVALPAFPTPKYVVVQSAGELADHWSRLLQQRWLGLDTETTGLDVVSDKVCLVQLAPADGSPVVIVDIRAMDVRALQPLFDADAGPVLVGHNLEYDLSMLH
jgi:hypothetical protein